jgi:histone H3
MVKTIATKAVVSTVTSSPVHTVRKHRFRPGTVAAREVIQQQKSTKLIIPKAASYRLFKEVLAEVADEMGVGHHGHLLSAKAVEALNEEVQSYLISLFNASNIIVDRGNRVTLFKEDLDAAMRVEAIAPSTIKTGCVEYIVPRAVSHSHSSKKKATTPEVPPSVEQPQPKAKKTKKATEEVQVAPVKVAKQPAKAPKAPTTQEKKTKKRTRDEETDAVPPVETAPVNDVVTAPKKSKKPRVEPVVTMTDQERANIMRELMDGY